MAQRPLPFISRVRIRNYRSIAACDVRLGPFTLLVGPNGSGKSNFLQALALLGRAINTTPYEAVNGLGGLTEIMRRIPESAEKFSIDVEATVPWGSKPEQWVSVNYGFEIGNAARRSLRPFEVLRETCKLTWDGQEWQFTVRRGLVEDRTINFKPSSIEPDRLYLPVASSLQPTVFGPLFNGLANMQFYNFSLDALREPSPPTEGAVLGQHGGHLGDVLAALSDVQPNVKNRIDSYLSAIVPGIEGIDRISLGGYVTVAFRSHVGPSNDQVEFGPASISDGTIRAAGVLAALFQLAAVDGRIPVIGIEEPEIALHPAAAGVLFDALTETSERTQVIVTTQSPDLLDRSDLDVSAVRAVSMSKGLTVIGEVDPYGRRILADKLYTFGQLMRRDQLSPGPAFHDGWLEPEA